MGRLTQRACVAVFRGGTNSARARPREGRRSRGLGPVRVLPCAEERGELRAQRLARVAGLEQVGKEPALLARAGGQARVAAARDVGVEGLADGPGGRVAADEPLDLGRRHAVEREQHARELCARGAGRAGARAKGAKGGERAGGLQLGAARRGARVREAADGGGEEGHRVGRAARAVGEQPVDYLDLCELKPHPPPLRGVLPPLDRALDEVDGARQAAAAEPRLLGVVVPPVA
mmetsp:Transcript_52157/g.170467  ORF Transcript_52157/g.170467 Transcript_52157/m.170467 type:complete len:233 (-) Transcript_52157:261-959(-)